MRATVIHGPQDVRLEEVPDPTVRLPTDVVVRVVDLTLPLDSVADACAAMDGRTAVKVMPRP